jgi:16S rRNA (cytosine967-C5)-methyltransferase
MPAPAREAAFRVLREISSGRGDLGDALSRARDPLPDQRDRALATDLAIGTLRWRNALDYQLQRRSAKPLAKLDGAVLDALRLGAYQLLYLARVPTSAAVNDSVDLVKRGGFRSAAGFANAVLRRLAREREALTWPPRDQLTEHLATVHSHPEWLVERWLGRYGEAATETWLRFNNEQPDITLVANRLHGSREALVDRLAREGIDAVPTSIAPHGVVVRQGRPLASEAFRSGVCLVQDEASQIIPELAELAEGAYALDLCASPGGKTIGLAGQCGPSGVVVATDVRPRRVQLLADTIARCRVQTVRVLRIPTNGPLPFRDATFGCVLIDAPCSGLGTIRRDPDIRWRRDPSDLQRLADAQRDLLRRVAPLVAPGGRIVYSTCSSEPEENEHVVAAFLAETPAFSLRPLADTGLPPSIKQMQTAHGHLRTTPEFGLEAFFGAILQHSSS